MHFKVDLKSRQHQKMDQKQNGKCLFPYSASHSQPRGGTMNMQWGGAMDMTVNVKADTSQGPWGLSSGEKIRKLGPESGKEKLRGSQSKTPES